jgi:hypothetical protein
MELVTILTAPTMNNEARTTYINQVLFGLELAEGAGFISGLDGSGILLVPLKANGIGVNDSISQT